MHIVEQSHTYWKGMAGFSKILFPTDFSNSANQAFENALCLPDVREVVIQHVVSTYFEKHPHWSTLFDIHETQKYMDMYVEAEMAKVPRQAQQNIHYRSVISEGKPAQQIVELADKEKVDVIVMGPAEGVVTGLVIRAASRPVLAIPQSDTHLLPLLRISKILVTTDCSLLQGRGRLRVSTEAVNRLRIVFALRHRAVQRDQIRHPARFLFRCCLQDANVGKKPVGEPHTLSIP